MARADSGARAQRTVRKGLLQRARANGVVVLFLAQTAARNGPVRFALVERGPVRQESALEAQLELVLASGERLRIGAGVEAATLRLFVEALRA